MSSTDQPRRYAPDVGGVCLPVQRRVRAEFAGRTVADSTNARLLRESMMELYYVFPEEDVAGDCLERTDHVETSPERGRARYWDVTVDDRVAERAAFTYPDEPVDERPDLRGYVGIEWDAVDAWYEEDERAIGHPRDPYHRIDTIRSSRSVRIELDGVTLADTDRAVFLAETGLPMRYSVPPEDVDTDRLRASDSVWHCPYKGVGTFWDVTVNGETYEDLAWIYEDPFDEARRIADRIAFYDEMVDTYVDGVRADKPDTEFV